MLSQDRCGCVSAWREAGVKFRVALAAEGMMQSDVGSRRNSRGERQKGAGEET